MMMLSAIVKGVMMALAKRKIVMVPDKGYLIHSLARALMNDILNYIKQMN